MIRLLVSDKNGKIFTHPHLEGVGQSAGHFFRLAPEDLIKLPPASRLFMLPARRPVGYEPITKSFVALDDCFAVSVFLPPGHTTAYNSAYKEGPGAKTLPLFSYAAAVSYKNRLHAAGIRVDKDRRHDSLLIDIDRVRKNVKAFKKIFRHNRLVMHLERCALAHGCPNAQNFFLSRYEAPLPTSPECNASCAGCISKPPAKDICAAQPRIEFIPTPEEASEIALFHIDNVKNAVVSFGQGCEGEPLLAASVIEKTIRAIRNKTSKGIININTNASRPAVLSKLLDAGLDSARVSMNSSREIYYARYYKPKGYKFKDVMRALQIIKKKGGHLSLNYLTMPGFQDWKKEFASLKRLVRDRDVDMVQWRNLNFDPMLYFKILRARPGISEIIGIKEVISQLRKEFPRLRMGYFNPREAAFRHL